LAALIGVLAVKSVLWFLFGFYFIGRIHTCDMSVGSVGVVRSLLY